MGIDILGKTTVLKDDRGIYKVSLLDKKINKLGEEIKDFWKVNISFPRDVVLKNKTKIEITKGFLTFFKIDSGKKNMKGEPIYTKFPKVVVQQFNVLEEGIDEPYKHTEYEENNTQAPRLSGDISLADDELPF
ncbi:MAG: hypothetical protein E7310_06340 [Clostridiales bacterium]|nr:hypothetical protein [Clostridiales bacterium]